MERRLSIEYSLNELKTLTAMYRVIAKTINAVEVVNENKSLKEAVKEVVEKLKLIS